MRIAADALVWQPTHRNRSNIAALNADKWIKTCDNYHYTDIKKSIIILYII